MRVVARIIIMTMLVSTPVWAQHQHGGHNMPMPPDTAQGTARQEKEAEMHASQTHPMEMPPEMEMGSSLIPNVPMQRDASGTSWLPDATAKYADHLHIPGWTWMLHGTAFVRVTAQDAFRSGQRGKTTASAPNWLMVMGQRRIAHNTEYALRGMFSLDPVTEGNRGYPLLFQTGESYKGEPLIDRQHPHDLVSELAMSFGQGYGDGVGYFAYFGYPGEPALGPAAFMHRPSAQHNPDSPLSHHWQDATHISYGVGTLGLRMGILKFDGSIFTGREPDDNRYNFERARWDSYSGRITMNPSAHWAVQASGGYLTSPEQLDPGVDFYRYTGSIMYQLQRQNMSNWATSVVWGMNDPVIKLAAAEEANTGPQHSVLVESDYERGNYAYYTRVEWVQKPAHDLGVETFGRRVFDIGAMTLGAARDLWRSRELKLMVGGQGSFYAVPRDLQAEYGSFPVSLEMYLRISPNRIM